MASTPNVDRFRGDPRAVEGAPDSYAGLAIHAMPGLHAHVAETLAGHVTSGRVLDVAAGSGAMSQRLLDSGFQVEAIEFAIDHFAPKEQVPCHGLDLNGDFAAQLEPGFDAIVAMEIIEHLENPRAFLRGLETCLRPGGTLVLTTPNADSPVSRAMYCRMGTFMWFEDQHVKELGHITPLSARLLRQAIADTGLELISLNSFGDPWHQLDGWRSARWLAKFLDRIGDRPPEEAGEALVLVLRRP